MPIYQVDKLQKWMLNFLSSLFFRLFMSHYLILRHVKGLKGILALDLRCHFLIEWHYKLGYWGEVPKSGWRGMPGKHVYWKQYRGFESHPLRHFPGPSFVCSWAWTGSCATWTYKPRQVRKEAAVSKSPCVPQWYLVLPQLHREDRAGRLGN